MVKITGGRRSSNVDDRRSRGPVYAAGGGAAGGVVMMLVRFIPFLLRNRATRSLLLIAVVALGIGWFVFPQQTQALLASILGGGGAVQQRTAMPDAREDEMAQFSSGILRTTEEVWADIFRAGGQAYPEPTLVLYRGGTRTGCGVGQAAMGPFYCPIPDPEKGVPAIYIDLSFFEEMETKMNAAGDFAQAYVIAHEVGHHIQNITGILTWSQQQKQRFGQQSVDANRVQVRVELQADCYAGVWANRAQMRGYIVLEEGDIEEAVNAAEAVGDDTLQRKAQGRVVPDAFTHGTAAQRIRWFTRGLETGDPEACDTRSVLYERL